MRIGRIKTMEDIHMKKLYIWGSIIAWLIIISLSAFWNVSQVRKNQDEIYLDNGRSIFTLKRSSKSHDVILTKTVQDFADIFFKSFDISRLEFHQFILHLVPKFFNAIEFWTVRRQEIECQPLLSQHLQHRLNRFRFVE